MTIQEAVERIDTLKPNKFPLRQKVAWLSDLDGMVWKEIYLLHESMEGEPAAFDGYDQDTELGTELLVAVPYVDIYQHYMATQMDIANAEMTKYAQDMQLFNNAWTTLGDYWTRTHMPKQRVTEFRL